jgi:hypothetical protein
MTRVKIDTPGVTVELDGDGSVHDLARQALRLFRRAGGWPPGNDGPATGFASAERREDARYQAHGDAWQYPVRAIAPGFAQPESADRQEVRTYPDVPSHTDDPLS